MGKVQSTALIAPSSQDTVLSSASEGGPRRRSTLFVKTHENRADDTLSLDLSAAYPEEDPQIDSGEQELIGKLLGPFFFSENESLSSIRVSLIMQFMKKEHVKKGTAIISEGDIADKLYMVSAGEIDITVDGVRTRAMGRGSMVGELGLLYGAPRSATVRCATSCDLWVLGKDSFEQLVSISSPCSLVQRGRWLSNVAELKALGSVALSALVSNLESSWLDPGGSLYSLGEKTSRCVLIETGVAAIEIPEEMTDLPTERIDELLGIIRPRGSRRKDWTAVDVGSLTTYLASPDTKAALPSSLEEAQPAATPLYSRKGYHLVHEGCVLGMGILFGKAGLPFREQDSMFEWKYDSPCDSGCTESSDCSVVPITRSRTRTRSKSICAEEGAFAPFDCVTDSGKLTCSFFTAESFVDLFGSLPTLLRSLVKRSTRKKSARLPPSSRQFLRDVIALKEVERKASRRSLAGYGDGDFRVISLLAQGTKSTIVLAELKNGQEWVNKKYALKIMSKAKVLESGKLRHTIDECKILALCHSPFIAAFEGFYQTDRSIVLCMEPVCFTDLYSIIQSSVRGMPLEAVRFYAASIVLALAHMHKKGIAYRGLHPENVRIDRNGYIRIVDFAFAKQIPYLTTDNAGRVKINVKSFTLCGAAEYLAPECIFNTGANHAVDMWALGVLVHEMHTQVTPFTVGNRNASEMEILQSVAACKKSGVNIQSSWDIIHGPSWKNFILHLLKPEMSSRLGVAERNSLALLDHAFFNAINKAALVSMSLPAPFIPEARPFLPTHDHDDGPVFTGSQALFKRFESISVLL